jgi:hypothetical protein
MPTAVGTPFVVEITSVDDDGVTVELINARDVHAQVALNVSVASSAGIARAAAVQAAEISPYERLTMFVPNADLPAYAGAAQLAFTADVRYDDGVQRAPTSEPFLLGVYAEPLYDGDADGEVAIASPRPLRDAVFERDGAELQVGTLPADPSELFITRRLCIRLSSTYEDAGVGEQFWTNDGPTFRTLRGADIDVTHEGTTFSGTLGDGIDGSHEGCLEISGRGIETGDVLTIKLWSTGHVNGHDLRVQTEATGNRTFNTVNVTYTEQTDAWFDITPGPVSGERFNLFMAASYALFRHGGLADGSLTVNHEATGGTRANSTTVWVEDPDDDEKFVIAHEVGHYVARNSNANFGNQAACNDFRTGAGQACDATGHSTTSKELQACAATEGYADFFAADVFNDHDLTTCFVTLNGSPTINCNAANAGYPLRMMETNCSGTDAGYGNETDWMRMFWDVHTRGSDDPTMNDVLRWMRDADDSTAWTKKNVYELLNLEANDKGGQINAQFDAVKDDHGIDHPED